MRGGKGWWPWAVAGAGLAGLVLLLVVTAVPLGGKDGLQTSADTGQVTGLLIAAGTAAAMLAGWALRTSRATRAVAATGAVTQAKDVLAEVVAEQWQHEARLRSLDDPDPIPVRWRTPEQPPTAATALMDHPANIEPAGVSAAGGVWWTASSADIGALADRFRRTRRRRLVILGGPGTGKTTLAMQLLLHLLATRAPEEPVPVLLPVAGWDTEEHPRLHDWLSNRLARDHPALRSADLGIDAVRAMTARGHILAVLDGLDELPPPAQSKVIIALNRSLGGDDQLILTSRTTEFTTAVTAAGNVITSAAVLEPRPLDPAAAAEYLTRCLPPHPGSVWQDILAALRITLPPDQALPGSAASGPVAALADVAATPLGLWLLRTVYIAPGANLSELADSVRFPDSAALRAHLFDHLIGALIATREPSKNSADPFRPRRRHDPAQVQRWLGYLAHHLSGRFATADGGPGVRDFAWWRLAATTLTSVRIRLTAGIAVGLTVGFTIWLTGVLTNGLKDRFAIGLKDGFAFGLTDGFAVAAAYQASYGLTVGLTVGFAVILRASYWPQDAPGFVHLRLRGRVMLFARIIPRKGVATALVVWPAFGLTVGLTVGRHHAWPAYLIATFWLAQRRRLPLRLMVFLDDAHRLGLLRAVGPIYQFRHAELQDHLTATYQPPA
ncbi:NACHT domain-containing protein [Actinomadura vinacea]